MNRRKHIEDELNELAPELKRLKQDSPFKVPEGYFLELPSKVMDRVSTQPQLGFFQRSLIILLRPQMAIAASIVSAIIVIGIYYLQSPESVKVAQTDYFKEVSDEDLNNYVAANIDDFEETINEEASGIFSAENRSEDQLLKNTLDEDLNQILEQEILQEIEEIDESQLNYQ